jgi:hypothetical protein
MEGSKSGSSNSKIMARNICNERTAFSTSKLREEELSKEAWYIYMSNFLKCKYMNHMNGHI